MQNNYHVYRSRQDIGSRIRYLHSEIPLSIALIDTDGGDALCEAIEYYHLTLKWPLTVFLCDRQDSLAELRLQFPLVSFIHFPQPVSIAAMINVMANECYTTYFAVTRSDLRITAFEADRIFSLFEEHSQHAMVTPFVRNRFGELIPTIEVPRLKKFSIDPLPFIPSGKKEATLYPFLALGIYERALFQRLRGYDEEITGEYWQFLDFGIRCWLYGYTIQAVPEMEMVFPYRQFIIENRSPDTSFKRVLTKTLAFRQVNGKNYIRRIGKYTDILYLREVMKKRLALFKLDFNELVETWKPPTEEVREP